MKLLLISLFSLGFCVAQAQVKVLSLEEAETQKMSRKTLDSIYRGPRSFFEGSGEDYLKSLQSLSTNINIATDQVRTKKDNGTIWCWFYVDKTGKFDYLLYKIEGNVTEVSKNKVLDSLRFYTNSFRFPVKITAAFQFQKFLKMGIIRKIAKGKHHINTLEEAEATTRPDTVKVISFNQLELPVVPDIIYRFKEMTELNLSDNKLTSADIDLNRLPKLRHIWLNGNQLTEDSLSFPQNKTLKILNIQNNQFGDVPQGVKNCKKLKSLWLGYNKLTALNEKSFENLRRLQDLNLYSCSIGTLPHGISKMRRLEVLDLYYNKLSTLPNTLGRMRRLQQLALSNNELVELPKNLGRIKRLQNLYVHHNKLIMLPTSIGKLRRLRILDINHNQFSTLPIQMGKLRRLEDLDMSHNNLSEVPMQMLQLSQLKKLYLRANPFAQDTLLLARSKPVIESLENKNTDVSY